MEGLGGGGVSCKTKLEYLNNILVILIANCYFSVILLIMIIGDVVFWNN